MRADITKREFLDPQRGLLNFVRANLLHEPTVPPECASSPPVAPVSPEEPPVDSALGWEDQGIRWFRRYDDTNNGRLTRDQLLRTRARQVRAERDARCS